MMRNQGKEHSLLKLEFMKVNFLTENIMVKGILNLPMKVKYILAVLKMI